MVEMRRSATAATRREACPPDMPSNTAMRHAGMRYTGALDPGMHRARMLGGMTRDAVCGKPAGSRSGPGARR
jgi:hypothetical protein